MKAIVEKLLSNLFKHARKIDLVANLLSISSIFELENILIYREIFEPH